MEHLAAYERTPRQYRKRADEYWENTIREERATRRRLHLEMPQESEGNIDQSSLDIENMSVEEIKAELEKMGIKTRLRLQELLRDNLKKAVNTDSDTV